MTKALQNPPVKDPVKDRVQQSVVAIIEKSNRFLLVKRSDYKQRGCGYWRPVSGQIKAGETQ